MSREVELDVKAVDLSDEEAKEGTDTITSATNSNKKRRKRSSVWDDFKPLSGENFEDGRDRAECIKCGHVYKADSSINGTGSLRRHLMICPKRENKDALQMILGANELVMRDRKVDQDIVRDKITRLIIRHELPLVFVEYEEFRDLISYLFPDYSHISKNTQMNEIVKYYNMEGKRIKDLLNSFNGKLSLTSDLWASITNDIYISLTVHYIDKDWVLHKKLLRFCIMPPPHTCVHICDMVSKMLCEWGIEQKLFSITLDDASADLGFVELLKTNLNLKNALVCSGYFFHNRCCSHILNIIVQDGLKCIDETVLLVRSSITYVKAFQVRKVQFLEICKQLGISSTKGLHADVSTRWNSTYQMLESALFYRRVFENLQLMDTNYRDCPDSSQWLRIEKLTSFLQPFNEITVLLSSSKYPTSNLYFHNVWKIHKSLLEEVSHGQNFMKQMAEEMKKKFDKYWGHYSVILAIALVFDPRYKLGFVDWALNKISQLDPSAFEMSIRVKSGLYRLFNEYKSMDGQETPATLSNPGGTSSSGALSDLAEFLRFNSMLLVDKRGKSQLDVYLEEPKIPFTEHYHEFDVLSYWKTNGSKYPDVARMARDVLAIPVSTIASESTFSAGGQVIDKYRSKLLPSAAEAFICLRDWMFDVDFRGRC
ncbi:zinc finger BED domain-containing protein RICESLEEPER 2-like isoform X3 [Telopea speciosissima]|uniref:zinc finger BED domain-containing protein RICESLEEPER 2-like isoform X3 n=1 Tax=Telopea speciosissima TaxID=54955 RepID=UPI001CC6BA9D|nr:zinc finger BED domain-containing protein RICESLEEPER 2-like isoform X3 [Telopea speciosissima]